MAPPPSSPARRRPSSGGGAPPSAGGSGRPRKSSAQIPAARPAPKATAKLLCLAGPQAGNEYVLEGDEMVVGRAADNAISIPDTSVSRKHVLLRNTGDGWAASDMGSGNGTLVNSAAIAEETPLSDGDVITLGDTELKFVVEGGAPIDAGTGDLDRPVPSRGNRPPVRGNRPPVRMSRARMQAVDPEAKARRKKLLIRIGAGVVLVALIFVGWQVKKLQDEKRGAGIRAQQEKVLQQARDLNQEGKNLVRDGKWVEAKAKFEQVLEIVPDFGNGTVKQYLERANKEIPVQGHLDNAEAALKNNQLGVAFKELEQCNDTQQQYERRDKLKALLETKMDTKVKDAQTLLGSQGDRAKMVELKAMAEDLLAVKPDHREGLEYKKTADDAIDRLDHPTVCAYGKDANGSCKVPPQPDLAVRDRFRNGDQSGAFAMAQSCAGKSAACKGLQENIKEFIDRFKKLESLSPQELEHLLSLDRKISGTGSSPMAKTIGVRISGRYLLKASSAKAKGDWANAASAAKVVLDADPGNVEAQSIVSEAKSHAKDLYMRAYSIKDSDPDEAIRLFKQVVEMTPKDDEYHVKAEGRLKKGSE
jgi:tetratricopeptide (TPR) repeat protein